MESAAMALPLAANRPRHIRVAIILFMVNSLKLI